MYKKVVCIIFFMNIFINGYSNSNYYNIKANNNNNQGYVLVGTGEKQGKVQIGTWQDPSFLKGEKGDKGEKGEKGEKGDKGDKGERGEKLKNQYKAVLEFRICDTKKTSWSIFHSYDFNNKINETGFKITIKLGKSYIDTELEKIQQELKAIKRSCCGEKNMLYNNWDKK